MNTNHTSRSHDFGQTIMQLHLWWSQKIPAKWKFENKNIVLEWNILVDRLTQWLTQWVKSVDGQNIKFLTSLWHQLCFRKVLPKCGQKGLKTTSLIYRDNTSLGHRTASRQCRSRWTGEDMTNVLRHAHCCIITAGFPPKCVISLSISTKMTHANCVPKIFQSNVLPTTSVTSQRVW